VIDPYKILDLEPHATLEEVKSAYKELAQIYHPDKHTNHSSSVQKRAHEKFSKINQAYGAIKLIYGKERRFKKEKKENEKKNKEPKQHKEKNDFEETLKRAERGYANSQFNLGIMYDQGKGVLQDDKEAFKWYRLAAEQGVAQAQFNLGLRYEKGEGVPNDDKEALRWCRLAAERGDASAQYNLGLRYGTGEGVPQNYVLAHMWFNISGFQGMEAANKNRDVSEKRMSSEQIERAKEMARNWIQKKSKSI